MTTCTLIGTVTSNPRIHTHGRTPYLTLRISHERPRFNAVSGSHENHKVQMDVCLCGPDFEPQMESLRDRLVETSRIFIKGDLVSIPLDSPDTIEGINGIFIEVSDTDNLIVMSSPADDERKAMKRLNGMLDEAVFSLHPTSDDVGLSNLAYLSLRSGH